MNLKWNTEEAMELKSMNASALPTANTTKDNLPPYKLKYIIHQVYQWFKINKGSIALQKSSNISEIKNVHLCSRCHVILHVLST